MRATLLASLLLIAAACAEESVFFGAPASVFGLVGNADREPVVGALVRLIATDDHGVETWTGLSTFTNLEGAFAFDVDGPLAAGTLVAAVLPDGTLHSPALRDGRPMTVQPATAALVAVIRAVTAAGGGPSWADLDAATLRDLHNELIETLPEDLDLHDAAMLTDWVRLTVGDELARAFDGELVARPTATVLAPDAVTAGPEFTALPPPRPGDPCNRRNLVLAGARFGFDVLADGSLCDSGDGNQHDAFDIAFTLTLLGDTFSGGGDIFPDQNATLWEDGTELVLGPVTTSAGLSVTRKIRVTPDDDVARYLEIVHNPTATEHGIGLRLNGDLGSDDETFLAVTQTGQGHVVPGDRFAATWAVGQPDPTVAILWDGYAADGADRLYFPPDNPGAFEWDWTEVRVPPGHTVVYAHFVWLTSARDAVAVHQRLSQLLALPPLAGLSAVEAAALANFHTRSLANVRGTAGAMAPGLLLSLDDLDGVGTAATTAALDGSFDALLLGLSAGHRVRIRSATGGIRLVDVGP
jgi:hypothetical protein